MILGGGDEGGGRWSGGYEIRAEGGDGMEKWNDRGSLMLMNKEFA